jgi:flagellar biogenesis protein FliO
MRLALGLLLVARAASADVGFQVVDHGDTVEVIAHDLTMKSATVSPIRSRLEVPLTGMPVASRTIMQDATVLQVELDGYALSVKTKLDKPEVHELAKLAKASQVGNDVHLVFPRHAIATAAAATRARATRARGATTAPATTAPATTTAAPTAAPATTTAAPTTTAPSSAATPAPAPVATKPTTAPTPAATTAPMPAVPTPAPAGKPLAPTPTPSARPIPPEAARDWSATGVYAIAALLALGAATVLVKKKQRTAAPASSIDVIAQRALGGKAKIVWLAAGQRELIVAVTGTHVRVLGQWARDAAREPARPAELPTATVEPEKPEKEKPVSPSVAGILKLRAATHGRAPTHPQIPITPERDGEVEPDLAWAKEILAATERS